MKFDTPATANPIDRLRVVSKPHSRIDGPLKTTGTAPYAHERYDVVADQAHGFIVGSAIAKGRITAIDPSDALASPGVIAVVTHDNAGKLGKKPKNNTAPLLGGPEVVHYDQAIAIVVAGTFEQARAAARRLHVHYARETPPCDLATEKDKAVKPKSEKPDTVVGDFDGAFASAPVKLDATYTTPDQSHAQMEPHASIAAWDGDKVTIWTSNQMIQWAAQDLAETLGIPEENVRVDSPFIGGGFGGKLWIRSDALLAALAARVAKRPVRVALTRPFVFNNTTHRPGTIQRIRIGADKAGHILAIGHESWSGDLPGGKPDMAVQQTRLLYAGRDRMTRTRLATLNLPEGNSMRAPGEASGMMALEIAIDELAEKLGMDPVELRILNDTQVDPEKPERPFSHRDLVGCLRRGAEEFGWRRREAKPAQRREGRWLIGTGMAAAFRNNLLAPSAARISVDRRGHALVETDMTDIGTGSYTILAQTAAEMLGLPIERVEVRLGDSRFPTSCGSGGQFGANNSTAGLYAACVKLRGEIASKLGLDPDKVAFDDGMVREGNRAVPLGEAAGESGVSAEDGITYGDLDKRYQQSTFGAHFVEVAVDSDTAEIRVRRMLAVCAAGRILNPKSARSQMIGAMTMGVGAALMEHLVVDKRFGYFVNHDLAQYEVPVHADIPHQEVIFLDETDPISSPMKAKGVAELGICGVAAAVANAVYNATGVRVRDYPVTLDKIIPHLHLPAGVRA